MHMRLLKVSLSILALLDVSTQPGKAEAANVRAWGNDSEQQCDVPSDITNAVAIAARENHNLALTADGQVRQWGKMYGSFVPMPADLTNTAAIAVGWNHFLAVRANGTVVAWGGNVSGALEIPVGLSDVTAVAANWYFSLALKADGRVVAWGDNTYGQCNVPAGLSNVVAVGVGSVCSVALRSDGTAVGWGTDTSLVTFVASLSNIVALSVGSHHCLALTADGHVLAGGDNSKGQCDVPPDLTNAVVVAAGSYHSLALKADGIVVSWGYNSSGQSAVPADLPFVRAIAAGSVHSLALLNTEAGPRILAPPVSRSAAIDSSTYFTVRAVGSPPLRYQWYFGEVPIAGATNAVLALTHLKADQSGFYSVVVSNNWGSVKLSAVLNVLPSLGINLVPAILVKGRVSATYRVDYIPAIGPTNAWVPLGTLTLTNSEQYFTDFSAIGQPTRLYRAVELP